MTTRQALLKAEEQLSAAGVPDALLDAEWLLSGLLHIPRLELKSSPSVLVSQDVLAAFYLQLERREAREPLQYIQGSASFMGHEFLIRSPVLIPRADTETLCEQALLCVKPGFRVLDLCCGSGCLGISIKLACPLAKVWASDLSEDAVLLTRENAVRLGAVIHVVQGDLFQPLKGLSFDMILCNPPYIPTGELPHLQPEVQHEPKLALDGGSDGLSFYRRILKDAEAFLLPDGFLIMEVGDGQAEQVSTLCCEGFSTPALIKDLTGKPRVLEAQRLSGVH